MSSSYSPPSPSPQNSPPSPSPSPPSPSPSPQNSPPSPSPPSPSPSPQNSPPSPSLQNSPPSPSPQNSPPSPSQQNSPPDPTSPGPAGPSPPVLSALIVGVVLCVLAGLGISVCVYRRKKRKEAQTQLQPGIFSGHPSTSSSMGSDKQHPPPTPGIALGYSQSTFTYEELAKATDNFSKANLLGQGGFGYVHKGILANGTVVAIKQLKSGSRQGEREFQAEIEIISRVHHRHLVSLLGYCITGSQRMLVYEFVPNNTLEFHLHENGRPTMNWSKTMRIAVGAAKGLAYLHEDCQPKIIHRDIKASNILIDNSFEAKARPLLKQALEDGNLDAVVDPKLQDYDFNEMTQMICCAAACVHHLGRFRPRMSQIVRALEGNMPLDELNEGITSGFSMAYISASSNYDTRQYQDDLKKFRKLALESHEHDNSTVNPLASTSSQECSGTTSESGRNTFSSCTEESQTN